MTQRALVNSPAQQDGGTQPPARRTGPPWVQAAHRGYSRRKIKVPTSTHISLPMRRLSDLKIPFRVTDMVPSRGLSPPPALRWGWGTAILGPPLARSYRAHSSWLPNQETEVFRKIAKHTSGWKRKRTHTHPFSSHLHVTMKTASPSKTETRPLLWGVGGSSRFSNLGPLLGPVAASRWRAAPLEGKWLHRGQHQALWLWAVFRLLLTP